MREHYGQAHGDLETWMDRDERQEMILHALENAIAPTLIEAAAQLADTPAARAGTLKIETQPIGYVSVHVQLHDNGEMSGQGDQVSVYVVPVA